MGISDWIPERTDYQYLMRDVWDKYADPRTGPYFPGGPEWLTLVILSYLTFVYYIGKNTYIYVTTF